MIYSDEGFCKYLMLPRCEFIKLPAKQSVIVISTKTNDFFDSSNRSTEQYRDGQIEVFQSTNAHKTPHS